MLYCQDISDDSSIVLVRKWNRFSEETNQQKTSTGPNDYIVIHSRFSRKKRKYLKKIRNGEIKKYIRCTNSELYFSESNQTIDRDSL